MTSAEQYSGQAPHEVERSLLRQSWRELIYVHWAYPVEEVQRSLPPGLTVDTFDGQAWVGLIPFELTLYVPGRTSGRPLSRFKETNVRTYVKDEHGRRGVWFYSLDADRLTSVLAARASYGLPYMWSPTEVTREDDVLDYRVTRRWPSAGTNNTARVRVRIGDVIDPADVSQREHFLTARWTLFSERFGINFAHVSHEPWPLRRAELLDVDTGLVRAAGLSTPTGEALTLYAPRVDVACGRPHRSTGRAS